MDSVNVMANLTSTDARRISSHLQQQRDAMVELLQRMASIESPSDDPAALDHMLTMLAAELKSAGMAVCRHIGRASGGLLYARPLRSPARSFQLLIGHCDTVWPTGTLGEMPLRAEGGIFYGPGVFDMKAGLVQMIFALRALRELNLTVPASCRVVINSDEEIGSPNSTALIRRLARRAERAFILEPAFGPSGKLKTARKAVGNFTLTIKGRAAHAGVSPEEGVSAILELSHQIQRLFGFNDAARGITVNVGTIAGGTRSNVIAAEVRARIDVRVRTRDDAQAVEAAIRSLSPVNPETTLHVDGGFDHPPMEPSERNQALWWMAHEAGQALGLELEQSAVGGASDGNTTSQYTATLDGLGAVGDGAHAAHEQVDLTRLVERAALLALLLMAPFTTKDLPDQTLRSPGGAQS
jgi:glutamate carboxypeptidase